MALGDELARTDGGGGQESTTGLIPLTPELEENVEVQALGDQVSRTSGPTTELPDVNFERQADLAEAVIQERQQIPEDDARTPPRTPSPEEGRQLGDAIKNVFSALETPGAAQTLQRLGVQIAPQEQGNVRPPDVSGEGLPAEAPSRGALVRAAKAAGAQEAQSGGGGGIGQMLSNFINNRDNQRLLANLGAAISPGGLNEAGEFALRDISAAAQEEFQQRLQRGESPGQAAARTEGLTAEDRQSVLEAFRGERQREFERQQAEEQQETEERLTEARIEELRQSLEQDDRALDLEAARLAIQQEQLSNEEQRLAINRLNAEAERRATNALADLREAQATATTLEATGEGGQGQEEVGQRILNANRALGAVQEQVSFLQEQARSLRADVAGLRANSERYSHLSEQERQERLQQKRQQLQEITGGEQAQGALGRLLQRQQQLSSIIANTADQIGGIQVNTGGTTGQPTEAGDFVPHFRDAQSVKRAIRDRTVGLGDTVSFQGAQHQVVRNSNGNFRLEPVQ